MIDGLEAGSTHSTDFASRRPVAHPDLNNNSDEGEVLKYAKLIIWDEAPMTNRLLFEMLDRKLRDLMQSNVPFAGKTIVLCGDFRQTLPVVKLGSPAQTHDVAITRSPLWRYFKLFSMTENMRIRTARDALCWTEAAAKPLKAKSDQDRGHVVAMTGTATAPAAVGSV